MFKDNAHQKSFLLLYLVFNPSKLDTDPKILAPLFGFNSLVGFIGYSVRFYTIPKLPTLIFSLLSFVGVIFGYVWGHMFTVDRPSMMSIIGSAFIVIAVFFVRLIGAKES